MTDKPSNNIHFVELDFESLDKMLKMSHDEMFKFLEEIDAVQNGSPKENKSKKKKDEPEGTMGALFDLFASEEIKAEKKSWDDMMEDMILINMMEKDKEKEKQPEAKSQKEEPIPKWASHRALHDKIEEMTQLLTTDGRVIGNAVIFKIDYSFAVGGPMFHIITDARKIISITLEDMMNIFHQPEWVLKDLPNNEDNQVGELVMEWINNYYGPMNPF